MGERDNWVKWSIDHRLEVGTLVWNGPASVIWEETEQGQRHRRCRAVRRCEPRVEPAPPLLLRGPAHQPRRLQRAHGPRGACERRALRCHGQQPAPLLPLRVLELRETDEPTAVRQGPPAEEVRVGVGEGAGMHACARAKLVKAIVAVKAAGDAE